MKKLSIVIFLKLTLDLHSTLTGWLVTVVRTATQLCTSLPRWTVLTSRRFCCATGPDQTRSPKSVNSVIITVDCSIHHRTWTYLVSHPYDRRNV